MDKKTSKVETLIFAEALNSNNSQATTTPLFLTGGVVAENDSRWLGQKINSAGWMPSSEG